jgi:hypothetical protein
VPDPFIDSSDDVPGMAGGLPEGRGAGWWDEFFADRAKPSVMRAAQVRDH